MGVNAFVTSEIDIHFPIKIDWNEITKSDIVRRDDSVDLNALRAYILTKALGNNYPALEDTNALPSLTGYIEDMESDNNYSFIDCYNVTDCGDCMVFDIALCYNYGGSENLSPSQSTPHNGSYGYGLQSDLITYAWEFAYRIYNSLEDEDLFDYENRLAEVACTNVAINGVTKEYADGNELVENLDAFVSEQMKLKSRGKVKEPNINENF